MNCSTREWKIHKQPYTESPEYCHTQLYIISLTAHDAIFIHMRVWLRNNPEIAPLFNREGDLEIAIWS